MVVREPSRSVFEPATCCSRDYAVAGIQRYWIVDPRDRSITVLALPDGAKTYAEEAVVTGSWQTDFPYPLTVDPADIF